MSGRFVLCFSDGENTFWRHVSLQYLNPRRSTLLRVEAPVAATFMDGQIIIPQFNASGLPWFETDLTILQQLDLDRPLFCTLHRLVEFEVTIAPWAPMLKLTIEPLSMHIEMEAGQHQFWLGAKEERRVDVERQAKASRAAAKRAEKRAAEGIAPKPRARRQERPMRSLQGPDQDPLLMLCDEEDNGDEIVEDDIEDGDEVVEGDVEDVQDLPGEGDVEDGEEVLEGGVEDGDEVVEGGGQDLPGGEEDIFKPDPEDGDDVAVRRGRKRNLCTSNHDAEIPSGEPL